MVDVIFFFFFFSLLHFTKKHFTLQKLYMIYCIRELTVDILYTLELTVQILYYKLLRNLLLTRKNQDFANCPLYLGILRAMKRKLK